MVFAYFSILPDKCNEVCSYCEEIEDTPENTKTDVSVGLSDPCCRACRAERTGNLSAARMEFLLHKSGIHEARKLMP